MDVAGVGVGGFQDVGNGVGAPRVFVGAPAFAAGGSGFVQGEEFRRILEEVRGLGLANFGGVMFWEWVYIEFPWCLWLFGANVYSGAYEVESAGVDGVGESYAMMVKEIFG